MVPSAATRLVVAGLVGRQINPVSRREVVVNLTETGKSEGNRVTRQRRREIALIVARTPIGTAPNWATPIRCRTEHPDVAQRAVTRAACSVDGR